MRTTHTFFSACLIWLLLLPALNLDNQVIEPELVQTEQGELKIYPILHATMVMEWGGHTIYIDPYGGAERFAQFAAPDLVLITHKHGDHLNAKTLAELELEKAELIAPESVVEALGEIQFGMVSPLANDHTLERLGLKITAVPMYNLPEDDNPRHPKGWGNGYVMEIGGKRIYISGDTEDIKEMRSLEAIDIAFVCMNLPYTMDVDQAASAVLDFAPEVIYPFHYRGKGGFSDVERFKALVNEGNADIEVRLRDWYPE